MKRRNVQMASKLVGASAALLMLATACGESGADGNLAFRDLTGAADQRILPVAEARSARYEVRSNALFGGTRSVESVFSSDEDVIKVVSFNEAIITIEGLKPGTASLEVTATNGNRDRLVLEVREEDDTYYLIKEQTDAGAVVVGAVSSSGKYNLQPADVVALHEPIFVDANGTRLSGSGDVGLGTPEHTGTMRATLADGDHSVSVTAGEVGDSVTLSTIYGSELSFRTVDSFAPSSITATRSALVTPKNLQFGTEFRLPMNVWAIRFNVADAEGYTYLGSTDMGVDVSVSSLEGVSLEYVGRLPEGVQSSDYCVEEAGDACKAWEGLPDAVFTVSRLGNRAAEAMTMTVTAGDVSEVFEFELMDSRSNTSQD